MAEQTLFQSSDDSMSKHPEEISMETNFSNRKENSDTVSENGLNIDTVTQANIPSSGNYPSKYEVTCAKDEACFPKLSCDDALISGLEDVNGERISPEPDFESCSLSGSVMGADTVSLVDIEASLDSLQANTCDNTNILLSTDVCTVRPIDGLDTCQPPNVHHSITSESSNDFVMQTQPSGQEDSDALTQHSVCAIQNNCTVGQNECITEVPMNEPAVPMQTGNEAGPSFSIKPGEMIGQIIEGPSITLPSSQLHSLITMSVNNSEDLKDIKSSHFQSEQHIATADINQRSEKTQTVQSSPSDTISKQTPTSSQSAAPSVLSQATTTTSNPTPESVEKPRVKKTPHDFIFGKVLGEGSYSTVYLAKEVSTQKEFAIKVCDKKHLIRERKTHFVMREKEVLMKLDHPFFVKLAYTFQDQERLYYVLTCARNGEMLAYLNKLSVFDVPCTRFYAAEIVLALEHLKSLRIVHRDLKPENILFGDDMHIKIVDFGTSKFITSDTETQKETKRKNSFVGTAEYVSPEVLNNLPANFGSDLWALGCIIFQCLSSSLPFRCGNEYQTFQKVVKTEYEFPPGFPSDAQDLVEQLLVLDPMERLGMKQPGGMAALKAHPFFTGIDWKNLPETVPPKLMPYLPATGSNPEFWGQENRTGFDDQRLAEIISGQSLDTSQPTEVEVLPIKVMPQMGDAERHEKLSKQRSENQFHPFVEDNLILRQGFVDKRKGLFARKRMLLLTEGPHLYYVDAHNKVLKGEIPWSSDLRPEAKNFKIFFVHTPNRTYYLESRNADAQLWVKDIQEVWTRYYGRDKR